MKVRAVRGQGREQAKPKTQDASNRNRAPLFVGFRWIIASPYAAAPLPRDSVPALIEKDPRFASEVSDGR